MAVIEGGTSAALAETGAVPAKGLHTIAKPHDYGSLGHYSFAAVAGGIAAGMTANGELLHFRWADGTRFAIIHKILLQGMRATTAFAVGNIDLKATIARNWTVAGTGGTLISMVGDTNNLRTSMGSSLVNDLRVATTAALGAGTKTLDTNDIGAIGAHSSGGPGSATPIIGAIYLPTTILFQADIASGEHPIVLAANEGFVVRATVPGTGVWNLSMQILWSELAAF